MRPNAVSANIAPILQHDGGQGFINDLPSHLPQRGLYSAEADSLTLVFGVTEPGLADSMAVTIV